MTALQATPVAANSIQLDGVSAGYGDSAVLRNLSLTIPRGAVVGLLGANGAGKTTTLRVIAGLLRPSAGRVLFESEDVTKASPQARVRAGLCLVPEGRGIFRSLTVRENLELQIPAWLKGEEIDRAVTTFPVLGDRLSQRAGSLSGGEQQMLALGRAFLANPTVVMLDEVSLGLAPVIVDQVFESLAALAATGATLLIVEQYVNRVLEMADRAYVLTRGVLKWQGPAGDLDDDTLAAAYLGDEV